MSFKKYNIENKNFLYYSRRLAGWRPHIFQETLKKTRIEQFSDIELRSLMWMATYQKTVIKRYVKEKFNYKFKKYEQVTRKLVWDLISTNNAERFIDGI